MEKINLLSFIHKGIRHQMFTLALELQNADLFFVSSADVIRSLEAILNESQDRVLRENEYLLDIPQLHSQRIYEWLKEDHAILHRLAEDLLHHLLVWHAANSDSSRKMAGAGLGFLFSEYLAFNLYHLNRKESELMSLLWQHSPMAEIYELFAKVYISSIPEIQAQLNMQLLSSYLVLSNNLNTFLINQKCFTKNMPHHKTYQRIIRFRNAYAQARNLCEKGVKWANLSYDLGYADQAHFIRDFRQFTGEVPSILVEDTGEFFQTLEACN